VINKELEMSNEFKSWDDMTVLEQSATIYSDMYKDAYGFRPRGINTDSWTESQFNDALDELGRVIEASETARKEDEAAAILKFEDSVTNLMHTGTNRARVIAWLMQEADAEDDPEYFCYKKGLPYNYFHNVK
jgi:hypothetical protein